MSSLSTTDKFMGEWHRLTGEFQKLQDENSFWLRSSHVYQKVFLAIAATTISCTSVYLLSFVIYDKYFSTKETPAWKKTKTCYQVTNFFFNAAISVLGVYYNYWILPTLPIYHVTSSIEKIPYLFDEFYLMPAMQLGYQVWSIPVGIFVVNENHQMILHHLGVVCAATLGAFSTFGFRYWLPYFFGVFELSSIPFAIVNTFNDHPNAVKKYPICNHVARISFALSFLYIRIYMWLPVGPLYIRNDFFLFLSTEIGFTKIFLFFQWMFGVYLGYLQLFWGAKVVSMCLKFVGNLFLRKQQLKKEEA